MVCKKCTFHYFRLAPPTTYAVFVRNETYIIATRTAELQFICPLFDKWIHYTYFALVQIPCNCIVSSAHLYIPLSLVNCEHPGTTVHISHPINLVQMAMSGFDTAQLVADQPQFQVHPPHIYMPEFSNLGVLTR